MNLEESKINCKNKFELINYLLISLMIIYLAFSPVNNIVPYKVFILVAMVFIVLQFGNVNFIKKFVKKNTIFILFFMFLILKVLLVTDYQPISEYHSFYGLIGTWVGVGIWLFIGFFIKKMSINEKSYFLNLYMYLFTISIIIGICYLLVYGNVYRDLRFQDMKFIPGVHYVYISCLLCLLFYYKTLISKDNKIESVLLFLINFIFVMLSSYTTQILILVLGIIVITSLVKIKNIKKVALIFTVLCLILLIFKNSIGDVIVTIFEKNVLPIHPDISMRMIEIGNVLKGNLGDTIDIQSRFSLSQMSINSFLKSPLFGIEFANYNTSVLNIGGHSEWFDDLGRYGAFGFSLISLILAKTKNIFYISKNRNYFLIFIVFFIVYGLFNPVIDGSIVAVFCIVVPNFDSVIFPFLYKKGNKV